MLIAAALAKIKTVPLDQPCQASTRITQTKGRFADAG